MTTRFLTNWLASTLGVLSLLGLEPSSKDAYNRRGPLVGPVVLVLAALLFLPSRIAHGIDDAKGTSINVDELSTTRFGDGVREILCIHTTNDILAVVAIRVPKDSKSSEATSGVRREDAPSRHGTAWAKYRWDNERLRVDLSTKLLDWIVVNGQRVKLSSGRVIYWDDRIMGQSGVLNGPLPQAKTSDASSLQRLESLRKRVRAQFPADATWDRAAGYRILRQRQMAGKLWPLVKGAIVDAETGERIKKEIAIQTGSGHGDMIRWSDHPNGSSVTDHGDGTFEATLFEWTSRVVVDGYMPKMILEQLPDPEVDQLERVLRLTRAPAVSGRVLNHQGEPVVGASVYAIGPMGLNVRGGLEWHPNGQRRRTRATPVQTNEDGRFRGLCVQSNRRIAVSCKDFDIWPAQLSAGKDEIEIHLPEPATMRIDFDIPGAPKVATVQIEAIDLDIRWSSIWTGRVIEIENGGTTTMAAFPEGRYQIKRFAVPHWTPNASDWLDQEFVELKPGEIHTVNWNRQGPGAIVKGRMTWDDDVKDLMNINLNVTSTVPNKHFNGGNVTRHLDAQVVNLNMGEFSTAKIPVGDYTLVVRTTQRVGTNREFFGNRRLAGTVLHHESFSFPFRVKGDVAVLDLGDVKLDPAKDPRGDALRKRDAERATVKD